MVVAAGRPLRFVGAGIVTALTYLGLTFLLSGPVGLPLQAAIPLGFAASLVVHFSLQRFVVFRSQAGFALELQHQLGRYLLVALGQYAFTATATAVLPSLLGVPERVVYLGAACVAGGAVFVLLRSKVFIHS